MHAPAPPGAAALVRRLDRRADPLALYAALSDGGRRADTVLIERSEGTSLLMDQAALRIECRAGTVALTPLSPAGTRLAARLEARFPGLRFERPEGHDAAARLTGPGAFDVLRLLLASPIETPEEPFTLALPGIVAFDHVDLFEALPAYADDPLGFPDFLFWVAESLVLFDPGAPPRLVCTAFGEDPCARNDAARRLAALAERCAAAGAAAPPAPPPAPADPGDIAVDLDDAAYARVVARMKEHIAAGEVYQIVPSRTFSAPCPDPLAAFAALRRLDPSPYLFFAAAGPHVLFGASPESAVRVAGGMVEVKPIAGTRRRGASADEDDRLEAEMRLDAKETAEHMMLVDLARNDVARVSAPGTRRLAALMQVERYARVMHLVSSVTGRLRGGLDPLHALAACLNVGTLTGAPKLRATELLRGAEKTRRGPYGGAIGWLNGAGDMDTGVVIRSALVKDGRAHVRAGAGVVHDSDPLREAEETRRKASALLSVLAGARP
jgi:anthranilate synthase component I